jgi:hypothetical protein
MGEARISTYSFKTQLHIPWGPSALAGFNDFNLAQTDRGVDSFMFEGRSFSGFPPCLISVCRDHGQTLVIFFQTLSTYLNR